MLVVEELFALCHNSNSTIQNNVYKMADSDYDPSIKKWLTAVTNKVMDPELLAKAKIVLENTRTSTYVVDYAKFESFYFDFAASAITAINLAIPVGVELTEFPGKLGLGALRLHQDVEVREIADRLNLFNQANRYMIMNYVTNNSGNYKFDSVQLQNTLSAVLHYDMQNATQFLQGLDKRRGILWISKKSLLMFKENGVKPGYKHLIDNQSSETQDKLFLRLYEDSIDKTGVPFVPPALFALKFPEWFDYYGCDPEDKKLAPAEAMGIKEIASAAEAKLAEEVVEVHKAPMA